MKFKQLLMVLMLLMIVTVGFSQDPYAEQLNRGLLQVSVMDTAETAVDTLSMTPGATAIILYNRSESVDLLYAYGNTVFHSLAPLDAINERVEMTALYFKTASGSAIFDLKYAKKQ